MDSQEQCIQVMRDNINLLYFLNGFKTSHTTRILEIFEFNNNLAALVDICSSIASINSPIGIWLSLNKIINVL